MESLMEPVPDTVVVELERDLRPYLGPVGKHGVGDGTGDIVLLEQHGLEGGEDSRLALLVVADD